MILDERLREFYCGFPMREGILCWYPFESGENVLNLRDGTLESMLESRWFTLFDFAWSIVLRFLQHPRG